MPTIANMLQQYAEHNQLLSFEGTMETIIPGVYFHRATKSSPRQPLIYNSGIIIVGQGHKIIHFPEHQIKYGAGDYLVLGVPVPLECEAFTDNDLPVMGIAIDINPAMLHKLVNQIMQHKPLSASSSSAQIGAVQSATLDTAMELVTHRLLAVLNNPIEADIFGEDIVKELVYRVLCGPQGHTLIGLAMHDGHYARIARTLSTMHSSYANQITVEGLAEDVNMSVSSFHRAFRQVTFESPLQYLKKVRLAKAKELITTSGSKANEAALKVGYTSPSQFSREFKRHFNKTPSEVLTQLHS
ncbi:MULTISPECIES: AraC family transcriptional regulator [Pseudoalteromonas]|uniref:AraC family transcriptional regulator n=1 Tax=Pseudoalteromonas TaxID=53246 RepID=UPI0015FB1A67|nr:MULTISPECIES: AraC family transcriptional regulator [unclassified Pseudoalteromonas]MBB1281020.1 AraC family transcriptional regulator [Pseudoalteromonas sp. SR41-1]MBB1298810.1 AraC family transcriptional regulator [Pseudoalteromonas sp. SR41-7]MBB1306873.1 AraC family transcriptional regulator [Pseudoalteromonas sp. SR43-5]MBB1345176.1 AraC family transcriptional regulator [Pseudoalteromonas sp. SG45-2]MBB1402505.1 AraC family transcriptional regulator [Pseudoalteromonas sp. SG45-1]